MTEPRNSRAAMAFAVIACALVIVCAFAFERWKFHECRKVGHSFAYCLLVTR